MDTVTRHADELSNPDRSAIEHLLGRSLDADHQVVIVAYKASAGEKLKREQARAHVEAVLKQAESHALASGVTAEEADEAIVEAMQAIRPRFIP
jgi:hypothetical protein